VSGPHSNLKAATLNTLLRSEPMKTRKQLILAFVLFICATCVSVQAQSEPQSVDRYLEQGKTIVIAKCLWVGPLKANLESDAKIQILNVLKGAEKNREIEITSRFGLEAGGTYLLSTEGEVRPDGRYFHIASRASAVRLWPFEDLELLKTLPVRTQIIRIFNERRAELDSEIRSLNSEREALEKVLKNQ
jgi:hypothetical protein